MLADLAQVLEQLAAIPAASFHEQQMSQTIQGLLNGFHVPFSLDRYGNILAHYQRGEPAQRLAMVAHMDHPAFELTEGGSRGGQAVLLGGVRLEDIPGAPVRVFSGGAAILGKVTNAERQLVSEGDSPRREPAGIVLTIDAEAPLHAGDWGVWEMPGFRPEGELLHMRAADDLAGCASILTCLAALAAEDAEADVYGIFTRAEEVGLVGATLVAQQGLLPPDTIVISVESSRMLPGAEQGLGPVLRVGDLRRAFHPDGEALLQNAIAAVKAADSEFKSQRQLMSGGTCEATAFGAFGYRTTGIALPLGNYHNVRPEGGLAPEYIHRDDLTGAARILRAAADVARGPITDPALPRLQAMAQQYSPRLERDSSS